MGATLTVLATILIFILVVTELLVYNRVETINHLTIDSQESQMDTVTISIHATFFHLKCDSLSIDLEATRGDPTTETSDNIIKAPVGEGCSIRGDLTVGKVGGNFHVATGSTGNRSPILQLGALFGGINPFQGANLSHTIHDLSFGAPFPGKSNPLHEVTNIVPGDIGQYQFHLKVIPTVYAPLRGPRVFSNMYSMHEQFVRLDLLSALSTGNAPGIYFYYDFYPVMVEYHERKPSFLQLLTRICGIVGGVFTVASVLDRIVFRAEEQIKKQR